MIKKGPCRGKIVIYTEVYSLQNHDKHLVVYIFKNVPDGTGVLAIHATSAELYILQEVRTILVTECFFKLFLEVSQITLRIRI